MTPVRNWSYYKTLFILLLLVSSFFCFFNSNQMLFTTGSIEKERSRVLNAMNGSNYYKDGKSVLEQLFWRTQYSEFCIKTDPLMSNKTYSKLIKHQNAVNTDSLYLENEVKIEKYWVNYALKTLHNPKTSPILAKIRGNSCIVVGAGSCLRNKKLGKKIDSFEVVIRLNEAPLKGYEKLVGSRTDVRILYPESAPTKREFYLGFGVVVVVPFKTDDFIWTAKQINRNLNESLKFWRKSADKIKVRPDKIFIMNPEISEFVFKKAAKPTWQSRGTTGFFAIQLALNLCGKVTIAGFCYQTDLTPSQQKKKKFASSLKYLYYYGRDKTDYVQEKSFTLIHTRLNLKCDENYSNLA